MTPTTHNAAVQHAAGTSMMERGGEASATHTELRLARRRGFTLVELLVVITIIGILAALLVPAVFAVVGRANAAAMRMEVESLSQAVEAYNQKYGDYPPDFANWPLVVRHYRKVFPNINSSELVVLGTATGNGVLMDRAEALVWSLGGFSSDEEFPFTGSGGPLTITAGGDPSYNTDRDNALFNFEPDSLQLVQNTATGVVSAGADGDLLPSYRMDEDMDPFVYFDSRTYFAPVDTDGDGAADDFNGFNSGIAPNDDVQGVRPYVSNTPSTTGPLFVNPKTFQVLGPGVDGIYGANFRSPLSGSTRIAYYFQYPTGVMITAEQDFSSGGAPTITAVPGSNGYLESSYGPMSGTVRENAHLDNVANFCTSTLGDDFVE